MCHSFVEEKEFQKFLFEFLKAPFLILQSILFSGPMPSPVAGGIVGRDFGHSGSS